MTAEEIIAVVQAHEAGKKIQFREHGEVDWTDTEKPCWNFDMFDYREKPEEKKELPPLGYRADEYARKTIKAERVAKHQKSSVEILAQGWIEGYKTAIEDNAS